MERVRRILRRAFGEAVSEAPGEQGFFVAVGRIGVRVQVQESGAVQCYSWIAQEREITSELGLAIARRNQSLTFGSLSVDGEDAIILEHWLFPESVDKVVLPRLVTLIAAMADSIDDELR